MRRPLSFLALAAICSAMMVSCKNKQSEPTPEEIQAQKVALADSVLSIIDNLAEKYQEAGDSGDFSLNLILSDDEKMVKPDYLLDPDLASTFVTKAQKITALSYYMVDFPVRIAYDMPLDANKEAIIKLTSEINYPVDIDMLFSNFDMPLSEKLKLEYNAYKNKNDLSSLWALQFAALLEAEYIFTNNPELYMSKLTEEQNQAITDSWHYFKEAISILADYDDEAFETKKLLDSFEGTISDEEIDTLYTTREDAIDTYKKDILHIIDRRNALLQ